jgi:hypothetical protein
MYQVWSLGGKPVTPFHAGQQSIHSAVVTDSSTAAAFFGIFHVQSTRCHVNVQRNVFRALSGLKRLKFTLRLSSSLLIFLPVWFSVYVCLRCFCTCLSAYIAVGHRFALSIATAVCRSAGHDNAPFKRYPIFRYHSDISLTNFTVSQINLIHTLKIR